MLLSKILTLGRLGLHAFCVVIETDVQRGLFNFVISGLGDKAVGESKLRTISAIKNSGYKSPKTLHQKIVVSLSPAGIKKEGTHYDLPIALSYLLVTRQEADKPVEENDIICLGELSLTGEIMPVAHILFFVNEAKKLGYTRFIIPKENEDQSALIEGVCVFGARDLNEAFTAYQYPEKFLKKTVLSLSQKTIRRGFGKTTKEDMDKSFQIDSVVNQERTKRALMISIAGKHHILLIGSPGSGKSLLAKSAAELQPDLRHEDAITKEVLFNLSHKAKSPSARSHDIDDSFLRPPFREPHHTASYRSIIGGHEHLGEISLAHKGILMMDECFEFDRRALEALRQPLEDKTIQLQGKDGAEILPADFLFVGTANPCRCGYRFSRIKKCSCRAYDISQYTKKMSGAIVDRIDLYITTTETGYEQNGLISKHAGVENGKSMADKIKKVRNVQEARLTKDSDLSPKQQKVQYIKSVRNSLSKEAESVIRQASKNLGISRRVEDSILAVSRTIADLEENEQVQPEHILEAVSYRKRD